MHENICELDGSKQKYLTFLDFNYLFAFVSANPKDLSHHRDPAFKTKTSYKAANKIELLLVEDTPQKQGPQTLTTGP